MVPDGRIGQRAQARLDELRQFAHSLVCLLDAVDAAEMQRPLVACIGREQVQGLSIVCEQGDRRVGHEIRQAGLAENLLFEHRFELLYLRLDLLQLLDGRGVRAADWALYFLAADAAQEVGLFLRADALGSRVDAESLGHEQDRGQQEAAALREVLEEDLVETDLVDGAALQGCERRVALAEIVERDGVAARAQLLDGLRDDGFVVDEGRLRDLNLQVDVQQLVFLHQMIEDTGRIRQAEIAPRQIDDDRHERQAALLPGVERLDGGLRDEVVEQVDLVGFFKHGNEVAREDLSTLWIMPACERLERADLVRQGAQDRLVADGDAAAAQSLFKMVGDVVAYGVVHFIYPFPDTGIIIVTFIITFFGG